MLLPVTWILLLTACSKSETTSDDAGGRYSGVGTYEADGLWKHVQGSPVAGDALAKLKDDSQIIVIVNRQTGEVRQCGNHSGFCVAMNPWQGSAPRLPAKLDEHADKLEAAASNVSAPSH